MPPATHSTAAPSTSDSVTGAARSTWGTTFWPRLTKEVRSRVTNSRFIITAYWTGSGRSSPKSLRTAASVSGAALRPAMRAAGSEPGVAKKIRNTSTLMPNITNSIWPKRERTAASMRGQRIRILARGSSASRTPSPRMLSASTVSTIAMPGASATQGRV